MFTLTYDEQTALLRLQALEAYALGQKFKAAKEKAFCEGKLTSAQWCESEQRDCERMASELSREAFRRELRQS